MKKALFFYFLVVAGLGFFATAIFARQFGLDHNADWGIRRFLLLGSGGLILVIAGLIQWRESMVGALTSWVRPVSGGRVLNPVFRFLWKNRLGTLTGLGTLTIVALYLFFVSAGTWTIWPESTRYYDDLATAFRNGHLYLSVQPSAAFLALSDPYEPAARNSTPELRAFVDTVYDASFYRGRFYLYWAPAPALLLTILKLFYAGAVPDQFLVFGFLVGLLIFTVLLILELWRGFYEDVPFSLALIGIAVAALASPIPWMLSNAAIYEATIAAGQFFLIGGLYFAFTGVRQQPVSHTKLLVAAIFWALAAASRTLDLLPAAFLTFTILVWEATHCGESKPVLKTIQRALILALPMTFAVLALGWYDWARFGSVLETGHRYSLTLHNLDKLNGGGFSASYVLPSLWIYLLHPFATQSRFPFILATYGKSPSFLYLVPVNIYHSAEVTGLLLSVPFVLFSVVAVVNTFSLVYKRYIQRTLPTNDNKSGPLLWISICLAGSVLLAFAVVLLYFDVRMRFLAEFVPSLMLLSVLGVWQGYRFVQGKAAGRYLYISCAIALTAVSVSISLLLAMAESYGRFRHYSPQLIKHLMLFFAR